MAGLDFDYLYEERAAIKQYCGNMTREQAEKEAREEVNGMMPMVEGMELRFD